MYDFRAIFDKQPAVIAGAIRAVMYVAVILGLVALDAEALAAIALGIEVVLTLFVVSTSTPTSNPTLPANTEVKVAGTTDTVIVQPTPPGPTGVDRPPGG